ncbi:cardiolipin synthase B [Croceicoccus estronivorus]|uniref:phospholipase D-like domain-containing protein n=1 Tax=Croceicoccus estronivorus TaxID=1172626 RepID=UPI00082F756E|nr:phosphatidylserine/phosphatidylglycerophosphate/cardiolipin synthase family protein [Croceicoccus estronivorus]OCC25472.1 cardiolipin synthase B [Croceicoccus estronivorus]
MDAIYSDPAPFSVESHGHELTFYPAGSDRLEALLKLIGRATRTLKLCFYVFEEDKCGRLVRDALAEAARRGVDVTLIVDRFGSDAREAFFVPLVEAGGRFHFFSPRWSRRYLIRNHQKIVIADGERAMIGGFNVQDDYFAPPEENGWHDLGMRLVGDAVEGLELWFDQLAAWTAEPKAQFRAIRRMVREWRPGDGPLRWLIGGPTRVPSTWARHVSKDISRARRLDMIMAYFSPAPFMLGRIARLAEGGEVRLLLPCKSDNGATIGASRSLYRRLLKHGAGIWEFSPCKLHTKLIVVDDAVYIGSGNFDMRSLYLNLELMLRIEDAALAEKMRDYVSLHLPASEHITLAVDRSRRTLFNRLRWRLSWFLVTVLDYSITRRLNLGLGSALLPREDHQS